MRNSIKFSIKYVVMRRKTFMFLCIMMLIALAIPTYQFITKETFAEIGSFHDAIFFNSLDNAPLILCIYILPLFFGIVLGDLHINELKFRTMIEIRMNKYKFYFANWIVVFIFGFLITLIFLFLLITYTYLMIGNHSTDIFTNDRLIPLYAYDSISKNFAFPYLYKDYPTVRILLYAILIAIYGGIVATLSYSLGHFTNNKFISYLIPFFLLSISMILCGFFGSPVYLQNIINPQMVMFDHYYKFLMIGLMISIILSFLCAFVKLKGE